MSDRIEIDIPGFILTYYMNLHPGKRFKPPSEGIDEIVLDTDVLRITIVTKRGWTRTGTLIGRKGIYINDLRNQIHEAYNEKWDIQIKKPDAWFCPKCELTFESKSMVKKHIAEMGYHEVFTDNDLSLDRKVLGVCRAVLEDGQICTRTRKTAKEFCGKCYRALKYRRAEK
jgi:hypothetical protein